ncbi:hypothetical protein AAMO2058_000275700 [Amorphochlora amoebiformis]
MQSSLSALNGLSMVCAGANFAYETFVLIRNKDGFRYRHKMQRRRKLRIQLLFFTFLHHLLLLITIGVGAGKSKVIAGILASLSALGLCGYTASYISMSLFFFERMFYPLSSRPRKLRFYLFCSTIWLMSTVPVTIVGISHGGATTSGILYWPSLWWTSAFLRISTFAGFSLGNMIMVVSILRGTFGQISPPSAMCWATGSFSRFIVGNLTILMLVAVGWFGQVEDISYIGLSLFGIVCMSTWYRGVMHFTRWYCCKLSIDPPRYLISEEMEKYHLRSKRAKSSRLQKGTLIRKGTEIKSLTPVSTRTGKGTEIKSLTPVSARTGTRKERAEEGNTKCIPKGVSE